MAIEINKITGYYGFTLDGTVGGTSDEHGRVNRCLFAIVFPNQITNVKFEMTTADDDWGAQMGDGTIIPLKNPQVLYVNRDSAIVQFDLTEVYPANSPCILVYRSDVASFNITNINDPDTEISMNHVSGNFAFTTEGYGGVTDSEGRVSKLLATFPFPVQSSKVKFNISNDPSHWGAHMGDGTIVALSNPEVITTNYECAIVLFDMDQVYPSNSPCIIVYRSKEAHISIKPDESIVIKPVTDIINVPETIVTGVEYDLSVVAVEPFDASKQGITWSILSGNATVDGDRLLASSDGVIKIRGTVIGGGDVSALTDFSKDFSINVTQNSITIEVQPDDDIQLIVNQISEKISVIAKSVSGDIHYKWFRNTKPSTVGGQALTGGIESTYELPITLSVGTYYYYCQISSSGAATVTTRIAKVTVTPKLTGIVIGSSTTSFKLEDTEQFTLKAEPEGAIIPLVTWDSSDSTVATVSDKGLVSIKGPGTATITATSDIVEGKIYKSSLSITVADLVPVTDIVDIITTMDTETNITLSGTVEPVNASFTDIEWSLVDPGTTGMTLDGDRIIATDTGTCVIRAMIRKGVTLYINYIKEFTIEVKRKYVPIEDVEIIGVPEDFRVGDPCILSYKITPENSAVRDIAFTMSSAGTTEATLSNNELKPLKPGTITLVATAVNGLTPEKNFTKTFQVNVGAQFIPVDSITGIETTWEYEEKEKDTFVLNGSVSPENATYTEIEYRIKTDPGYNVTLEGNTLSIDHSTIEWWKENPDAIDFEYYSDKYILAITDPLVIEATIRNGTDTSVDYVLDISITIESVPSPNVHVALDTISIDKPSIVRARRPILGKFNKEPWNATNGAIHASFVRKETGWGGFSLVFNPSEQTPEYWKDNNDILLTDEYDWTKSEFYYYIFEDGIFRMEYVVENGNEDKTSFLSSEDITVLPEYIPISNIGNVPGSFPKNVSLRLFGEPETNFDVKRINSETYDVEVPSYVNIKWSVVNAGNTGAKISNGTLKCSDTGTCVIRATVENGLAEEYDWYETHHEGKAYTKDFTIDIRSNESSHDKPVVTLTLDNGNTVKVYKESEIYNMSNDLPSSAEITVGGQTFRKDQVTEIKFWDNDSAMAKDTTTAISNISFGNGWDNKWNGVNSKFEPESYESITTESISTRDSLSGITEPVLCSTLGDENKFHEMENFYQLPKSDIILTNDGKILQYTTEDEEVNVLEELGFNNYSVDFTKYFGMNDIIADTIGCSIIERTNKRIIISFTDIDDNSGSIAIINNSGEFLLCNISDDAPYFAKKFSKAGNVYTFIAEDGKFTGGMKNVTSISLEGTNTMFYHSDLLGANVVLTSNNDNSFFEIYGHDSNGFIHKMTADRRYYEECIKVNHIKLPCIGTSKVGTFTPGLQLRYADEKQVSGIYDNDDTLLTTYQDGINLGYWSDKACIDDEELSSDINPRMNTVLSKYPTGVKLILGYVEGQVHIGSYMFDQCESLKSIIIPKEITSVGKNAFHHCTSLTDIYYEGTEDDITIDDESDTLDGINFHYNYQPITIQSYGVSLYISNDTSDVDIDTLNILSKNNICYMEYEGLIYNFNKSMNSGCYVYDKANNCFIDFDNMIKGDSYLRINKDTTIIKPSNATKRFDNINFSLDANNTGSKLYQVIIDTSTSNVEYLLVAGTNTGNIGLEMNVENGIGLHDQDFRDVIVCTIGNATSSKEILGVNPTNKKLGYIVYTQKRKMTYIDVSADVLGVNLSESEADNIQWSISGMTMSKYTGIRTGEEDIGSWWYPIWVDVIESTSKGKSVKIAIANGEPAGTDIVLKASYEGKSVKIHFVLYDQYADTYDVEILTNFARNFTKLVKIDRIPEQISGPSCLRNFLKGCESFNQEITIPEYVTGDRCLEGFLSGCKSFNKPVIIPEKVEGKRCLTRFLENCESFNQEITIPETITGDYSLMRFLAGCKSFNKPIVIPEHISGRQCLDHFMFGCETFNHNIKIPEYLEGIANLRGFMRDTMDMCSTVTVPLRAAINMEGNGLTLACFKRDVAYDTGVKVTGAGASLLMNNIPNMTSLIPLRRLINTSTPTELAAEIVKHLKFTSGLNTNINSENPLLITNGTKYTIKCESDFEGIVVNTITTPTVNGFVYTNTPVNNKTELANIQLEAAGIVNGSELTHQITINLTLAGMSCNVTMNLYMNGYVIS